MHSYSTVGGSSDFASRYPTRVLVGHWLYSSEPAPNQHAVYGILSRDGKLRFKLVSETRDGKPVRGNYPPPSETWLIHQEIVLEPHLIDLNRLGMKEYCRERGRQVTAGEDPADVAANILKAVEYAERVSTTLEGQRPRNLRWEREKCADRQRAMRKMGTASAHAKAAHEKLHGIRSPSAIPTATATATATTSDVISDRQPQLPIPPQQSNSSSSSSSSSSKTPSHHRSSPSHPKKRRSASPLPSPNPPMPSCAEEASEPSSKDPSPRVRGHRLPNDRPTTSFRAANVVTSAATMQERDRLPPLKITNGFHAANSGSGSGGAHDDKERLPPLHATLANDKMDLDAKDDLPPLQLTNAAVHGRKAARRRQPLPQHHPCDSSGTASASAPRKALPGTAAHARSNSSVSSDAMPTIMSTLSTGEDEDGRDGGGDEHDDDDRGGDKGGEPRIKTLNGITYIRQSSGSFRGNLVSPGKIITIDGQDYVEYCVLTKLSSQ